jgi:hypothetical protein
VEPSKKGRTPVPCSPSLTLWEYGATIRRHVCCYTPYGHPSAAPSSQRTDNDQTRSSHTATLEAAHGRTQGTPRRSARSEIR